MIVYLALYSLIFVWKLRVWGAFWSGRPEDTETAAALLIFHVVFGLLLAVGWILFIGREWVYQVDILPYLRPEPRRPLLERVRQRWG